MQENPCNSYLVNYLGKGQPS
uniref:Uncharacterized protein n=1 Tax=Rhizophora mucronata TaxID=61149 RepID=A0A2P2P227_RHIMU